MEVKALALQDEGADTVLREETLVWVGEKCDAMMRPEDCEAGGTTSSGWAFGTGNRRTWPLATVFSAARGMVGGEGRVKGPRCDAAAGVFEQRGDFKHRPPTDAVLSSACRAAFHSNTTRTSTTLAQRPPSARATSQIHDLKGLHLDRSLIEIPQPQSR